MNSDVQRVVGLIRRGDLRLIESDKVLKDVFERLKNEGIVSLKKVTEIKASTDPNSRNYPKQVERWAINNPKLLKSKYGVE